jgi:uncharacterized delta-60 repeat protein
MRKGLCISAALTVCVLALVTEAAAAAGDLDSSFGTGGTVTSDFGGRGDAALAVAIQPDGKIVAVGNSSQTGVFNVDFALARYMPNGSLDPTFGSGGTVLSDFGSTLDAGSDVVLQPDGGIVVAGTSNRDFAIARYTSSGVLDPSFGGGGLTTTDLGSFDQATALARQPDGKFVVAGIGTTGSDFAVARFSSSGNLDPTFGAGGVVTTDFGPFDQAFDVAVTPSGKIVVAGRTGGDFALARYLPDGSLDPSFGTGGKVTTDFGSTDSASGLAVGPGEKVTLAGSSGSDFALARYNDDGSLDASFGSGGRVATDFAGGSDNASAVVVEPSGMITAVGFTSPTPGTTSFALARYSSNGSVERTVTASFDGHNFANALDVAAQPDGAVVVAGVTGQFGTGISDFALARFLGAPTAIWVPVDIKPDSADNVVPLQANGVLPVAILTTSTLDATTVDPQSVCFGAAEDPAARACVARQPLGHREDVNGDGRVDLLLQYDVAKTGIDPGDTQACLTGRTTDGVAIEGCDSISTR